MERRPAPSLTTDEAILASEQGVTARSAGTKMSAGLSNSAYSHRKTGRNLVGSSAMQSVTRAAASIAVVVLTGVVLFAPMRVMAQGRPMIEHIEPTAGPPGTQVRIVGR